MKIAIDHDGVLLPFHEGVLSDLRNEKGIHIPLESITSWAAPPFDDSAIWDWFRSKTSDWARYGIYEGAEKGLQRLRDTGHYLELLTQKQDWMRPVVWDWMAIHNPPLDRVTVANGTPKHECSDADVLIDDAAHNIREWVESGRRAILFEQPWSRDETFSPSVYRVRSWDEIPEVIDFLERGVR